MGGRTGCTALELQLREVVPCNTVRQDVDVPDLRSKKRYAPFIDIDHTPVFEFARRMWRQSFKDFIGDELISVQDMNS